MRASRLIRRYKSEIKIAGTFTIICILIGIYNLIHIFIAKKVEGSTLSSTSHKEQVTFSPTYTPYPTLIAPTTIQINIYINNTTPIYNDVTSNAILDSLSLYPTQYISTITSNNITNTPVPTTHILPTSIATHTPTPTPTLKPLVSNFNAKYFNNINLGGTPVFTRSDSTINFEWNAESPDSKISTDNFSIIWEGKINASNSTYQITLNHDDGMRIFIDNNLIHNHWVNKPAGWEVFTINLTEGEHSLRIEYYEYLNGATAQFDIKKL